MYPINSTPVAYDYINIIRIRATPSVVASPTATADYLGMGGWPCQQPDEKMIVIPWQDPIDIDPLPPVGLRQGSAARAQHDALVQDMLMTLVVCDRPDLARHELLSEAAESMIATIDSVREHFTALPDARDRWDAMVSNLTAALDEDLIEQREAQRRKSKRGAAKL